MAQRVFLSGGAGRIGSKVLKLLLEKGFRVRALVHRQAPRGISSPNLELARGDILDQGSLKEALRGCGIVCHLAAAWDMFPPAVYEKENDQLFESVIRGTYNLLEAARGREDLELFLYASTDAVYATGARRFEAPITEDNTELAPSRFYALAKIVGETMCRQYGSLYGLPWLIVRICWALDEEELLRVYSYEFWREGMSPEDRESLAPKLAGGKGLFAPLMEDGESAVDCIADPWDIAAGIVQAVERRRSAVHGTYNLAGPGPFRYLEVIEKAARALAVPWYSARIKGIHPYELRIDRARRAFGYDPQHTMERMLEKAARRKKGGL